MIDEREMIDKLKKGEMKLREIEKYADNIDQAVGIRRKFIEEVSNSKIEHLSNYSIDMESASKKNIEQPIGAVQIPVGIAGPLKVNGDYAQGEFYV
ncbi:MAG TPA: 3-hydroxy-3-methylglutaryl-CoA reductase, partial [Methanobacterium sp.]|nr:3-hydroxy-3-methylglutaryl-CoA reductase [Methanobacterium sp.]